MGTSFFHESNFQGLIEKVRERGRASTTQRMTEQINRLFSASDSEGPLTPIMNCGEGSKAGTGNFDSAKEDTSKPNKDNLCNKDMKHNKESGGSCNADSDILSSKDAILSSSATLSENLANLSFSQGLALNYSVWNKVIFMKIYLLRNLMVCFKYFIDIF